MRGAAHGSAPISFGRAFGRALRRRCPKCGHRPVFDGWFTMQAECGGCRYRFEREEGFFLGAFTMNFVITQLAILVVLGVVIVRPGGGLSTPLLGAAVAAAVAVPFVCYPISKMVWCAVDLTMRTSMGESFGGDGSQIGFGEGARNVGAGRRPDGTRVRSEGVKDRG